MGDKAISEDLAEHILTLIRHYKPNIEIKHKIYPMYKDKNNRTPDNIDNTKTRIYISVEEVL